MSSVPLITSIQPAAEKCPVAYIAPVTKERKIDMDVILFGVSLMSLKKERAGPVIQYQNS
jgi:hypothetical protein